MVSTSFAQGGPEAARQYSSISLTFSSGQPADPAGRSMPGAHVPNAYEDDSIKCAVDAKQSMSIHSQLDLRALSQFILGRFPRTDWPGRPFSALN